MKTKKSIIIVCIIFIVGLCVFFFTGNTAELESSEEVIETSSRSFGIMVETDNGDYEQYTDSDSWPTDYIYNDELSYCKDKDGNDSNVTMSYSNGTVTVTGTDATYCVLYFRKENTDSSLQLLEVLDQSGNLIDTCESTSCEFTVGSAVTAFKIRATATDSTATFTFTGSSAVYSGTATSSSYTLTAGSTTTKYVTVTAEDGSTTTYTIAVYKQDNDATLSSIGHSAGSYGNWTTECDTTTTTCRLAVAYLITSVTLTPVANSSNATVESSITITTPSTGLTKTTTITVIAEDGTTLDYTINIYRGTYGGSSSTSGSTSTTTTNCTCVGKAGGVTCSAFSSYVESESECTKNENLSFWYIVSDGVCTLFNSTVSGVSEGSYTCTYSGS